VHVTGAHADMAEHVWGVRVSTPTTPSGISSSPGERTTGSTHHTAALRTYILFYMMISLHNKPQHQVIQATSSRTAADGEWHAKHLQAPGAASTLAAGQVAAAGCSVPGTSGVPFKPTCDVIHHQHRRVLIHLVLHCNRCSTISTHPITS